MPNSKRDFFLDCPCGGVWSSICPPHGSPSSRSHVRALAMSVSQSIVLGYQMAGCMPPPPVPRGAARCTFPNPPPSPPPLRGGLNTFAGRQWSSCVEAVLTPEKAKSSKPCVYLRFHPCSPAVGPAPVVPPKPPPPPTAPNPRMAPLHPYITTPGCECRVSRGHPVPAPSFAFFNIPALWLVCRQPWSHTAYAKLTSVPTAATLSTLVAISCATLFIAQWLVNRQVA